MLHCLIIRTHTTIFKTYDSVVDFSVKRMMSTIVYPLGVLHLFEWKSNWFGHVIQRMSCFFKVLFVAIYSFQYSLLMTDCLCFENAQLYTLYMFYNFLTHGNFFYLF